MTPRMPRLPLPETYKVAIVADSVCSMHARRLTTFVLTYPRFIHSELLTHRMLSRNSASSRAIPADKMRALVRDTPALPVFWGQNQPGMQARAALTPEVQAEAQKLWLEARDLMLQYSEKLAVLGLHKQLCNRITEPWMPITVLVSATDFANLFHLRDHADAQPELQRIVTEMRYQYEAAVPVVRNVGEWHLPFIDETDRAKYNIEYLRKVSAGRCARVSYLTHDGVRDPDRDVELHDKLVATTKTQNEPGHYSPLEHQAVATRYLDRYGNFIGWSQYRKMFSGEAGPG